MRRIVVVVAIIALMAICGISSLSFVLKYVEKASHTPIQAKVAGATWLSSSSSDKRSSNTTSSSGGSEVKSAVTEGEARLSSLSLFGLRDVKVMPSCSESDGTFLPPLVSFLRIVAQCRIRARYPLLV